MIILTNAIFFMLCAYYSLKLNSCHNPYSKHMARFILLLGTSSLFGATAHVVHFQLGDLFFRLVFALMSSLSMVSMYFLFRASYSYDMLCSSPPYKYIVVVTIYILIALISCIVKESFLLLEINGGIALLYALAVHYRSYRLNREEGSRLVIIGIFVSMGSIIVHLAKISLHEWFNQKDLAHVIMILALIFMARGARLNGERLGYR
jgi:hypothetical protein